MRILYLLVYRHVPGLKTIKILLTPAKFAKITGIVQHWNRLKIIKIIIIFKIHAKLNTVQQELIGLFGQDMPRFCIDLRDSDCCDQVEERDFFSDLFEKIVNYLG